MPLLINEPIILGFIILLKREVATEECRFGFVSESLLLPAPSTHSKGGEDPIDSDSVVKFCPIISSSLLYDCSTSSPYSKFSILHNFILLINVEKNYL